MKSSLPDHARALAGTHHPLVNSHYIQIEKKFLDNVEGLFELREFFVKRTGIALTSIQAGTWFLDNFYLIEDQVRKCKRELHRICREKLPCLTNEKSSANPRILDFAVQLVAEREGLLDLDGLLAFTSAYQDVSLLSFAELWSLPVILRVVQIENIRTIAASIAAGTSQELTKAGYRQQAADQGCLANHINSLRFLASADWRTFVDRASKIERILSKDAMDVYHSMDFTTRDHYRSIIYKIAQNGKLSEEAIAEIAVKLSKDGSLIYGLDNVAAHVGYYLAGKGLKKVEMAAGVRYSIVDLPARSIKKYPGWFYFGVIVLVSSALWAFLISNAHWRGLNNGLAVALSLTLLFCLSQVGVAIADWLTPYFVYPALLSKMDFSAGIPAEFATIVVIPAILRNEAEIDSLVQGLEVKFLANKDAHLYFGLLTDFRDSVKETLPEDEHLLGMVLKRIHALNNKYGTSLSGKFFLFHRARKYNANDRLWMGYERKRGKLQDLNAFLKGLQDGVFSCVLGQKKALSVIKYVICLDSDTQLPKDAAWRMVGTMAHPLNRAIYDEKKRRVVDGYGMMQPRVASGYPEKDKSLYTLIQGIEPGIDPYTRATSDVYQDLFGKGSFIGKGIYDIDVFVRALHNKLPDNRILSHDLLEGCYARSGLISDVWLFEEHPSSYIADVKRRHRWIRGDWQVGSWVLPFVPGVNKTFYRNPLSYLDRWKIFDNLRRSGLLICIFFLLTLDFLVTKKTYWLTTVVFCVMFFPFLISFAEIIFRRPKNVQIWRHFRNSGSILFNNVCRSGFQLACLPFEAFYNFHAIHTSVWRMAVTRKNLLEWNPSVNAGESRHPAIWEVFLFMWPGPAVGFALLLLPGIGVSLKNTPVALLSLVWIVSPLIVWFVSQPLTKRSIAISAGQTRILRKIARKTWSFFETFANRSENWLPPDNYQEFPVKRVSHRTSPTNIGLSLLANLSAYDFGYLTTAGFIERCTHTLATLMSLERWRGHFYNWYDTQTLLPVKPAYISTVDSGNLGGHLLTLRQGALLMLKEKVVDKKILEGLLDTIWVLNDIEVGGHSANLEQCEHELASLLSRDRFSVWDVKQVLEKVRLVVGEISDSGEGPAGNRDPSWARALANQIREAEKELHLLFPWLSLPPAPGKFENMSFFNEIPVLGDLESVWGEALLQIRSMHAAHNTAEEENWLQACERGLSAVIRVAKERIEALYELDAVCTESVKMEYGFLYNKSQRLLSIGYNVDSKKADLACYDLLASEARLAVFLGIAMGELPEECWFALGRPLVHRDGMFYLLSWGGTMFEYLMPELVMPSYADTLLHHSNASAVKMQIEFGARNRMPWGISECAYGSIDINFNYRYKSFGVPDLRLQRGSREEKIIAPYATLLALLIDPGESIRNIERLLQLGMEGRFGFFEAIDYSQCHPTNHGKAGEIVQSYMSHHQGMSFVALDQLLHKEIMHKRFTAEPMFRANLLLLQEKMLRETAFTSTEEKVYVPPTHVDGQGTNDIPDDPVPKNETVLDTPAPEIQFFSNGRYRVIVTNAGGGCSRWKEFDVTRWREDATCDDWGFFCYLREPEKDEVWSVTHQPTRKQADSYSVCFSRERALFTRCDHDFQVSTEVVVSPVEDMEIRRVRIRNCSARTRSLEAASYVEPVLAPSGSDALHPAFSNLFVESEIMAKKHAILCTRRPRSKDDRQLWLYHVMTVYGVDHSRVRFETDRSVFLGRGNSIRMPGAMTDPCIISNGRDPALDPALSIRHMISMEPGQEIIIDMVLGIAEDRDGAGAMIENCQGREFLQDRFELVGIHNQALLKLAGLASGAETDLYRRLAAPAVYATGLLRSVVGPHAGTDRQTVTLPAHFPSGDMPVMLVEIEDLSNIQLVDQLIKAHTYWCLKGLQVDLVICNNEKSGFRQFLHTQIQALIVSANRINPAGDRRDITLVDGSALRQEELLMLKAVSRIFISDVNGSLEDQLCRLRQPRKKCPELKALRSYVPDRTEGEPSASLLLFNGIGGFTLDGSEYVIRITPGGSTPMPWINVLANPHFGTIVSEGGSGYTWVGNAHEDRLTPWNNDPVTDTSGEAFYLRDEEDVHYWSPTPLPTRGDASYEVRHGFGYTAAEHTENGIHSMYTTYVDIEDPVKIVAIKLRNNSKRARIISVTGYVEWVLGDIRSKTAMSIETVAESNTGAIFARRPNSKEFGDRIAFFHANGRHKSYTADRCEFLGRNGSIHAPEAMTRLFLSGRTGQDLDPCAAIQVSIHLAPGEEQEVLFLLGACDTETDAVALVRQLGEAAGASESFRKVVKHWRNTLKTVRVETPDPSLNILANGWLLYQTIACRLWGRSGYYQSGGGYGFRDQLQDVLATLHAAPNLAREHILRCAAHQFREGDVLHWWHPATGKGVRTHCSDDFLWLPFALSRYLLSTGDQSLLEESVPYLEGGLLGPHEETIYSVFLPSNHQGSLYEHCVRAIRHGLAFGDHGLPLMGSGDWNDSMDRVGCGDKGESVWLGFFLYRVLVDFADLAFDHGDTEFAAFCIHQAKTLKVNLTNNAWDGAWYRRAYFDDGNPLGSMTNKACKIDSLSQSWSVLSGAGEDRRSRIAMDSAYEMLVRKDYSLIQLLDPPFHDSSPDPGYIQGYIPGVRENGGQYTHASIWMIMAFSILGDRRRAWELFDLINPLLRSNTPEKIAIYKVEPYVVAADVYMAQGHAGRGGWTWYTGSSGWMYQLIMETFLGLRRESELLWVDPHLPETWDSFMVEYRYKSALFVISVLVSPDTHSPALLFIDGVLRKDNSIRLFDDGHTHRVQIVVKKKTDRQELVCPDMGQGDAAGQYTDVLYVPPPELLLK